MITQIIRKQFFCITDVCNWKISSQRILLCNLRLQKVPHGGAGVTQNKSLPGSSAQQMSCATRTGPS